MSTDTPVPSATVRQRRVRFALADHPRHKPSIQHGSFVYNYRRLAQPIDQDDTSVVFVPQSLLKSYKVAQPFLFPILFPLELMTAAFQSLPLAVSIIPLSVVAGALFTLAIPIICIGGASVSTYVVIKALSKFVYQRLRSLPIPLLRLPGLLKAIALFRGISNRIDRQLQPQPPDTNRSKEEEEKEESRTAKELKLAEDFVPLPSGSPSSSSTPGMRAPAKAQEIFQNILSQQLHPVPPTIDTEDHSTPQSPAPLTFSSDSPLSSRGAQTPSSNMAWTPDRTSPTPATPTTPHAVLDDNSGGPGHPEPSMKDRHVRILEPTDSERIGRESFTVTGLTEALMALEKIAGERVEVSAVRGTLADS